MPLASSSATRVSARSTLTSTCFFNVIQSFGIGWGRARRRPGAAPCGLAVATGAMRPRVGESTDGLPRPHDVVASSRCGGLTVWREVLGVHWCL